MMPSTRRANPAPSTIRSSQLFKIPDCTHLLITTARHIFAWDSAGIRPVFRSRKGGIVAAREAKDGSGVLAVASSNVVVLHDTKRAKQDSWGLSADQDEVRFLEYGPDAKSLFITTTTDGAVQNYSTERLRLLEPAERLATPPAALAVSPTGHLVLSASLNPPVIHLKSMTMNTASLRIHPNASSAPISCAVFHPERPNVFLIAYRDGTVAAYDASRMPKRDFGVYADPGLKDGEIGHFSNLHRGMVEGDSSLNKTTLGAPIIGIAFLPGFKTRAVTAGRDGKCKIIDFAKSGEVLRSWHAKAPLTSISVVAIKTDTPSRSARGSRRSQASAHTIGGPTSTESMIAVGRIDGKVQVYNTVGLLLAEQAVTGQEEKVLSVEWIKGESPQGIQGDGIERHFSAATFTSLKLRSTKVQTGLNAPGPLKEIEVPQAKSPNIIQSTRKLVVHPDEIEEEGTVRRTPAAKYAGKSTTAIVGYQDLFSPVKPETTKAETQQHKPSPRKNRPRLSSQTFVKCPPVISTDVHLASPHGLTILQPAESHATSSESAARRRRNQQTTYLKSARRTSRQFAQADNSVRRISFAQGASLTGDGTMRSRQSAASTKHSADAKILADIRRLAQPNPSQRSQGNFSGHAASHRHNITKDRNAHSQLQQSHNHPPAQRSQVHVSDPDTWPTDSVISSLADNEDIWLTSDSNDATSKRRRRKARTMNRPPGRQTSRSMVDHMGGTMSTAISHDVVNSMPSPSHLARVDGSTEEEMFSANSHLPSHGTFSPTSEDVRELFPRSSSLSPRRRASPKRRNHGHVSPERKSLALTAMSLNQALGRQPKSPWAKAKASRRVPSPRKGVSTTSKVQRLLPAVNQDVPAMGDHVEGPSECSTCPDTRARVQSLENEVAVLKGEVLAMKAILRRNGLPFPACLR